MCGKKRDPHRGPRFLPEKGIAYFFPVSFWYSFTYSPALWVQL